MGFDIYPPVVGFVGDWTTNDEFIVRGSPMAGIGAFGVKAFGFVAMQGSGRAHAELEHGGFFLGFELNAGWSVEGAIEDVETVGVGIDTLG